MAVVLEQRSTAGAVHHYEVGLINQGRQVCCRERPRAISVSRMLVKRSAADLARRLDHSISIGFESPPGRPVDMPEQSIHDAAPEEGDSRGGRRGLGMRSGSRLSRGGGLRLHYPLGLLLDLRT